MGRDYMLPEIKKSVAKNVVHTTNSGASRAAEKSTLQPDIKDILFDMITANPKNRKTMEGITNLAGSIAREGLLSPLVVVPANAGYMLISGERRYHAIAELRKRTPELKEEFKTIRCVVVEPGDEFKQQIQLIAANTTARQLTNFEYRNAVADAEKAFSAMAQRGDKLSGTVQEMTASVFGVSTRQIRSIKAINDKLIPELRDACDNESISLKAAAKIAMLEASGQRMMYKVYLEKKGISESDIEEYKLSEESKRIAEDGDESGKKARGRAGEGRMLPGLNRLDRSVLNIAQIAQRTELTDEYRARLGNAGQALLDIARGEAVDIKALTNSLKQTFEANSTIE